MTYHPPPPVYICLSHLFSPLQRMLLLLHLALRMMLLVNTSRLSEENTTHILPPTDHHTLYSSSCLNNTALPYLLSPSIPHYNPPQHDTPRPFLLPCKRQSQLPPSPHSREPFLAFTSPTHQTFRRRQLPGPIRLQAAGVPQNLGRPAATLRVTATCHLQGRRDLRPYRLSIFVPREFS